MIFFRWTWVTTKLESNGGWKCISALGSPSFQYINTRILANPKNLQHDITLGWELEMFVNLSLNFYRDPFFPRQRKTPLWGAFKHVRTNVIDDQPHLFVVVVVGQWEHLSGDHHRDQWKICHVIPSESQENWKSLNDVWPRPLCMLSYSPSDALSLSLRSQLLHHPWERAITVISN